MPISPIVFRQAFSRFQAITRPSSRSPFTSFRVPESHVVDQEDYKEDIARAAARQLDARHWSRKSIGAGTILDRVIAAIEIPDNNLLYWQARNGPNSRVHRRLHEAKSDPVARRVLENVFYTLYRQRRHGQAEFEKLIELCGARYELVAYLFFIADRHRFLPIRTTSFDLAFAELGLSLRTQNRCNWDNYQEFLAAIREVQSCLIAEGIPDTTLLDAHSFCWILARMPHHGTPPTQRRLRIRRQLFSGTFQTAAPASVFIPNDHATPVDMATVAENRVAAGRIAEEHVLRAEKERLAEEGRPDLAAQVVTVADRPGLGYDLKSFNRDGSDRFIEVKNITARNRFFLSAHQWQNSRNRSSYWFYLVSKADSQCPLVTMVSADQLRPEHLQPIEYLVVCDSL